MRMCNVYSAGMA